MEVSVESTSGLGRRLTIAVPVNEIDDEVAKRLNDLARRVRLDGFRPGKVPKKVVRRRFGVDVRREVLGDKIQRAYVDAVAKEELNPAGVPLIEPVVDEDGKDFVFTATIEVYPEIELADFGKVEVIQPVAEVAESDVDEIISTLRKQNRRFEDVERAAALGDQVVFDYTGTRDGVEFAGGKAESSELELGSGRMIPGFEDGLVGLSAGDEKVLELTFPEEYHSEELAGQQVEFDCRVHKVQESVLPELDEEFFSRFGITEGGEETFRSEVRKNMERELRQTVRRKVKDQVMKGIASLHSFDLPSPLVKSEIDRMRDQMLAELSQRYGQSVDPGIIPSEIFDKQARERVALGLLVGEIIRQRDIKVDESRVQTTIYELASAYQQPAEVIDWYYQDEEKHSQIKYLVMEEQVVDAILADASVTEESCSYQEAIKPEPEEEGADEEAPSIEIAEESDSVEDTEVVVGASPVTEDTIESADESADSDGAKVDKEELAKRETDPLG